MIVLLSVIKSRLGNHAVFSHLLCALISALEYGNIRAFGIYPSVLQIGFCCVGGGFRCFQGGALLIDPRLYLFFIQLHQHLTLLHRLAIIHEQFFHNAAGFRLNVDLGDGLDLSGSYNVLGQVTAFHLGQLRWINAAAATGCRHSPNHD